MTADRAAQCALVVLMAAIVWAVYDGWKRGWF